LGHFLKDRDELGVVANAFNPSTLEAEAGGFLSSEASLVYRVSSWTARATQRNPVSKREEKRREEKRREEKRREEKEKRRET
jgi:hypothetical protein